MVRATLSLTTLALMLAMPTPASAARGETLLVSRADGLAGAGGNDASAQASVSADGRFVAFHSSANNLSTGDNDDFVNVFVRDTEANTTTLASQANGDRRQQQFLQPLYLGRRALRRVPLVR